MGQPSFVNAALYEGQNNSRTKKQKRLVTVNLPRVLTSIMPLPHVEYPSLYTSDFKILIMEEII